MTLKPEEIKAENSRLEEELRRAIEKIDRLEAGAAALGKADDCKTKIISRRSKGEFEMKRPRRWLLTFLWTFPADIISWFFILLVRLTFGAKLFWIDGLWAELRWRSWPDRVWGKRWAGVTMAHGGIFASGRSGGKGVDTKTELHELVHVEQFEARMLASFVLGLSSVVMLLFAGYSGATMLWVGGSIWMVSWPLGYTASLVQAYLRGEDPYEGSYLEEAAYAIVEDIQTVHPNCRCDTVPLEDDGRR